MVVFDRIRERSREDDSLPLTEQVAHAVSATLTRTLYTSGTTLLPLLALIFFGGATLYWFAVALALGVVVGSWSSIALAPSLLSLWQGNGPPTAPLSAPAAAPQPPLSSSQPPLEGGDLISDG